MTATPAQWFEGARPRTFPNAIAPVIAGSGAAASLGSFRPLPAALALVVSLALIVGVNYANDYSDGIRGTDDDRVGPMRLVGSGLAAPGQVRTAAFIALGIAGLAGIALAVMTAWWLVLVGLVCVAGAWLYTGGPKPYGYAGFGEIAVFVFFGLVAVLGTQFVQAERVDWVGLACAIAMGSFSSAVLVTNNLRDITTDAVVGKRTLAVALGDRATRMAHAGLLLVPFLASLALIARTPWALLAVVAVLPAVRAHKPLWDGETGPALIPALRDTGLAMLLWAVVTAIALAVAA
ncbi:1,4-dihydroxy-2-naphthoate polyprenyltransferase [Millisia brevis]|uniref:1,4-dihydroxy-2-naphthoate polyprenyltransferase n=1 Tax=Millisia brevis TaxID=264148 RepID=UPI000835A50D|nr:1,4-dihydroxy-2-naphthoate polyprenyltransferase [Millisia brevis]